MTVITLTDDNFEEEVNSSDKPVLVDYWATWCGPCKMVGPIVEEIAEQETEIPHDGNPETDETSVEFCAEASDSDGDDITYAWTFNGAIPDGSSITDDNALNDASIMFSDTPIVNQFSLFESVLSIETLVTASVPVFKILTL